MILNGINDYSGGLPDHNLRVEPLAQQADNRRACRVIEITLAKGEY
jgi:hypothetical protein